MTPGHVPSVIEGTQFVQFSPADEMAATMAQIQANAAALSH